MWMHDWFRMLSLDNWNGYFHQLLKPDRFIYCSSQNINYQHNYSACCSTPIQRNHCIYGSHGFSVPRSTWVAQDPIQILYKKKITPIGCWCRKKKIFYLSAAVSTAGNRIRSSMTGLSRASTIFFFFTLVVRSDGRRLNMTQNQCILWMH